MARRKAAAAVEAAVEETKAPEAKAAEQPAAKTAEAKTAEPKAAEQPAAKAAEASEAKGQEGGAKGRGGIAVDKENVIEGVIVDRTKNSGAYKMTMEIPAPADKPAGTRQLAEMYGVNSGYQVGHLSEKPGEDPKFYPIKQMENGGRAAGVDVHIADEAQRNAERNVKLTTLTPNGGTDDKGRPTYDKTTETVKGTIDEYARQHAQFQQSAEKGAEKGAEKAAEQPAVKDAGKQAGTDQIAAAMAENAKVTEKQAQQAQQQAQAEA